MSFPSQPRKSFNYGSLITDTLKLAWRHRFLWFFGLFAGSSTSFGGWSCNFQSDFESEELDTGAVTSEISDWVTAHTNLVIAIIIAAVAIALLLWLWSLICQGAVIATVRDINAGKPASFSTAWHYGKQNFTRLLIFNLFLALIALGVILIVFTSIIFMVFAAPSLSFLWSFLREAWLLLIPLGLVMIVGFFALYVLISLIILFAMRAVVLDANRPLAALRRGWRLLDGNFGTTLLVFLLSYALGIAGSIIMVFALIAAAIPAVIAWIIAFATGFSLATILIAACISLLAPSAFLVALAAVNTYFSAYWTTAYIRLSGNADSPV